MEFLIGIEVGVAHLVLAIRIPSDQRRVLSVRLGGDFRKLHLNKSVRQPRFSVSQSTRKCGRCLSTVHDLQIGHFCKPQTIAVWNHNRFGSSSRYAIVIGKEHRWFGRDRLTDQSC